MSARVFHAVPGGIYVSFHWSGVNLSTTGVYWIVGCKSAAALPTLADVTAVATAADGWLTSGPNPPKTLISSDAQCDYIRAWSQAEEAGPEFTIFTASSGSATPNDNASECCLCEMETGVHARGVNGRLFFGPIDGSQPGAGGLLTIGYAGAVGLSIESLLSTLTTAGYQASVLSQKHGIARPILSVRAGIAVAIQSRRMAGRD